MKFVRLMPFLRDVRSFVASVVGMLPLCWNRCLETPMLPGHRRPLYVSRRPLVYLGTVLRSEAPDLLQRGSVDGFLSDALRLMPTISPI